MERVAVSSFAFHVICGLISIFRDVRAVAYGLLLLPRYHGISLLALFKLFPI